MILAFVTSCRQSDTTSAADPAPSIASGGAPAEQTAAPVALAVVTAVDYEFAATHKNLDKPRRFVVGGREVVDGTVAGQRVVVIRAGWGKGNAAGATALLIERYRPRRVLMAGIAGSLVASAATSGDIVIVDGTLQHDMGKAAASGFQPWRPESPTGVAYEEVFRTDEAMLAAVWSSTANLALNAWMLSCPCAPGASCETPHLVGREHPRACVGVAASGDVFVADVKGAAEIAKRAHSVIVDMETAAVAQECANQKIPFAALRVVADVVAQDGESLYECLKPHTGQRLQQAMATVLPALVADVSSAKDVPHTPCAENLVAAAVQATLAREQQLDLKSRAPAAMQLR